MIEYDLARPVIDSSRAALPSSFSLFVRRKCNNRLVDIAHSAKMCYADSGLVGQQLRAVVLHC